MDNNQNGYPPSDRHGATEAAQPNIPRTDAAPTAGFAIASLVLGVLSLLCCFSWFIGGAFAILSFVFALVFRKQNGRLYGMATAGFVMSIVGLAFFAYNLFCDALLMLNPGAFEWLTLRLEEFLRALEAIQEPGGQMNAALHLIR